MPKDIRDISSQTFTVTNWNEDLAMDCDNAADAELADVLGTLINELKKQGLINASVSA